MSSWCCWPWDTAHPLSLHVHDSRPQADCLKEGHALVMKQVVLLSGAPWDKGSTLARLCPRHCWPCTWMSPSISALPLSRVVQGQSYQRTPLSGDRLTESWTLSLQSSLVNYIPAGHLSFKNTPPSKINLFPLYQHSPSVCTSMALIELVSV